MNEDENSTRYVRSVDRALDVLETLARAGRPLPLGSIVRQVGIPKSTGLNIIRTLVRRQLLERYGDSCYRIGPGVALLVGGNAPPVDLPRVVRPHLEALAKATRETIVLAALDGALLRTLDKINSSEPIQYVTSVGGVRPLHCTSGGKIALAFESADFLEDYIDRVGLSRHTDRTITQPLELRNELAMARTRGYAISNGELFPDLMGLAAPILDKDSGAFLAAVVISGPTFRMERNLNSYVSELRKAAMLASDALAAANSFHETKSPRTKHHPGLPVDEAGPVE